MPPDGVRAMFRWERFRTFAREPERRKQYAHIVRRQFASPHFLLTISDGRQGDLFRSCLARKIQSGQTNFLPGKHHLFTTFVAEAWKASKVHMAIAKKNSAKKSPAKKPSSSQHCWPGFEPVPGKSAGEKGSCKPKKKQSKTEKEGDRKAAAATKAPRK